MQFLSKGLKIDFMGKRWIAMTISVVVLLGCITGIAVRGLSLGIDFTGGTLIEVGYKHDADPAAIREAMVAGGYPEATVQRFGTARDILIRLAPRDQSEGADLSTKVLDLLGTQAGEKVDLRRIEFVGPQIGDELTEDGALAVLVALMAILVYVALRFEWRFAVGSVIALVHDVIFTIGVFAILGVEFGLPVLAAVLAVIGYSLNDTIVVYDRIRENFRKMRKGSSVEIVNTSLNQTLSRTTVTSLTTALVLLALFFLGGEIIHGFAMALLIGVVVGTYSSIYVASTSALLLGISKADLMPAQKEGKVVDDRP